MPNLDRFYISPGEMVLIRLPASEVCMHMRVTDAVMWVELLPGNAAQLRTRDRFRFSFPILAAEAGLYYDRTHGHYVRRGELLGYRTREA